MFKGVWFGGGGGGVGFFLRLKSLRRSAQDVRCGEIVFIGFRVCKVYMGCRLLQGLGLAA